MDNPLAHDIAAHMALLPANARRLVQLGGNGALARHYRSVYPACFYQVIERDPARATVARQYADVVHQANIEQAGVNFYEHFAPSDCWIFDQLLETLRAPQLVLERVCASMAVDACVVARIQNGLYHDESGLPAADQLRLFNHQTMLELFAQAGLRVVDSIPLAVDAPAGRDPERAMTGALPSHYIIKAVPA